MILRLALLALAALAACGRHDEAPSLFADDARHAFQAGEARGEGEIGTVVAARMTPGGRVVVLDFVPPFVKVFGPDGRLEAAFAGKGDGPGELRAPATLAVSGDSTVLVADARGGLTVFALDGRVREHAARAGIVPLAAAECGGAWMLYGPSTEAGGTPRWLHEVRLGEGGPRVRSLFPDALPPGGIGIGTAYGMAVEGGEVRVRHASAGAERVVAVNCARPGPPRVVLSAPASGGDEPEDRGGEQVARVGPGTRTPAGMALAGGATVLAEVVGERTELTLWREGRVAGRAAVAGAYHLRDSGGGRVLVSAADPAPRVFILRERDFMGLFSQR